MSAVSIEQYSPRHRAGIVELLGNENFKRAIWEWQFSSERASTSTAVVAMESGRCVGFNGAMPITIATRGEQQAAAWSCDFFVSPRLRGKGVGQAIKREFHRLNPLAMSLGISESATRVLEKAGWNPVESPVCQYLRQKHVRSVRGLAICGAQIMNRVKHAQLSRPLEPVVVELSSKLPENNLLNQLWARSAGSYPVTVARNSEYLEWRYQKHPLAEYSYLLSFEGKQLLAMAVFRKEPGYSVLVDYVGPAKSIRLKSELVSRWLAENTEIESLQCTTSDSELGRILERAGFLRRYRQQFYIYGAPEQCTDWFVMGGDSDGELLQAARDRSDIPSGSRAAAAP